GANMVAPVTVERIEPSATPGEFHRLHLDCGTSLRARTVLIAAGVKWRKLEADGAQRFESQGIHYACTSVEAILYDKTDVAVVGDERGEDRRRRQLRDAEELIVEGHSVTETAGDRVVEDREEGAGGGVEVAVGRGEVELTAAAGARGVNLIGLREVGLGMSA